MILRPDPDPRPRVGTDPRPAAAPRDERSHAPDAGAWWGESWDFDFVAADARLGGYVRLGLLPNQRSCWYWACVVGAGRDPVMVVDHEVEPPRRGLEVRSDGLWADHIVEEPLDHVSVGCEAFALRLDDPASALAGPLLGERTPLGLDLGWETDGPVLETTSAGHGYALPCRVVGHVLVGDERLELDASGWRRHRWGVEDWWSATRELIHGRLVDGTWIHDDATVVAGPGGPSVSGTARDAPTADGTRSAGPGGAPSGSRGAGVERSAPSRYHLDPVAAAPILLPVVDGRAVLVSRLLCRITDLQDGRTGAAWTERYVVLGEEIGG